MKKILVLVAVAVLAFVMLTACGGNGAEAPAANGGEAAPPPAPPAGDPIEAAEAGTLGGDLNVWSFTNEARVIATAFQGVHPDINVQFTLFPMEDGVYFDALFTALATGVNVPDVVFMEADFVRTFVLDEDILMDIGGLMSYAEALETIPFTIQAGTDDNGIVRAFSYQATPGAMFYRRSMAIRYFGTDDPAEIQPLFADLDVFIENARIIRDQSGGTSRVVSSPTEVYRAFLPNRANPWVVNEALHIDPLMFEYMDFARILRQEGLDAEAGQWSGPWFDGMRDQLVDAAGNPLQVFSFFMPTWGLAFVLYGDAQETAGDWGIIPGPLPYQWGGTWLGVTQQAVNVEAAIEFVRFATLDEDHLRNWALGVYTNEFLAAIDPDVPADLSQGAGDLVSSARLIRELTPQMVGTPTYHYVGGQNPYEFFGEAAMHVQFGLQQGTDATIGDAFIEAVDFYIDGEIDREGALASFRSDVGMAVPWISVAAEE